MSPPGATTGARTSRRVASDASTAAHRIGPSVPASPWITGCSSSSSAPAGCLSVGMSLPSSPGARPEPVDPQGPCSRSRERFEHRDHGVLERAQIRCGVGSGNASITELRRVIYAVDPRAALRASNVKEGTQREAGSTARHTNARALPHAG